MNIAVSISKIASNLFNHTNPEPVVDPEPVNKILEFTDAFVTECVEAGRPVFEWDGTKGMISDYLVRETAGEWRLKIAAQRKNPFVGTLIAVPTGRRTANIYKRAKIREMASMGISNSFAALYVSRSRNIRYNMEPAVIQWVYKNYLMPQAHLEQIAQAMVPKAAALELGYESEAISQSRFGFAVEIIRSIRKGDPVIQFAIQHSHLRLPITVLESHASHLRQLLEVTQVFTDLTDNEIRRALVLISEHTAVH